MVSYQLTLCLVYLAMATVSARSVNNETAVVARCTAASDKCSLKGTEFECNEGCTSWKDCNPQTCGTCSYGVCIPTPYVSELDNGQSVIGVTANTADSELYYRFQWYDTMPVALLNITLTSINHGEISLLVASTGDIATMEHHQYINDSSSTIKSILVPYPKHIEGSFGWGITAKSRIPVNIQFTIELNVLYEAPKCPDKCSDHGHCIYNNSVPLCVCNHGWGGVACAYLRYDLTPDNPVSVTIKQEQYIYFNISTRNPPFNNMTVLVQTFSKNVTAIAPSLYVAHGYYPTPDRNMYNDTGTNRSKSITILDPMAGVWLVALLGQNTDPLVLTVQVNMDDVCFSKCSLNGKCTPPDNNGYVSCQCSDGFAGEYCQEYTPIMKNSTSYLGYVSMGFWNYWHFNITVDPTDEMFLVLSVTSTTDGQHSPDLYTQSNGRPMTGQFICHESGNGYSSNTGNTTSTCVVKDKSMLGKGNSWYMGVLGTSVGGWGNYTVSATLHLSGTPPSSSSRGDEDELQALLKFVQLKSTP